MNENENNFYGKYRALVSDNQDPEKLGRLRLVVPSALGTEVTQWALPCSPFGGTADQGFFMIPEIDSQVWAEFEEGNIHKPIWSGVFWQASGDVPVEGALDDPTTRLIKTPAGHILQFDDESGAEQFHLVHPTGTEIMIDEEGTVDITTSNGESVVLDASSKIVIQDSNGNTMEMSSSGTTIEDSNGNKVEMAASGITVKGATINIDGGTVAIAGSGGEPLIKGTTFLSWLASHTHNCTAPGAPSGPPVPPPTPALLTTKTTAS
ncbi:MAG: phage baseplate assembly protein V [Akkermansiaceae bacterium]